MAPQGATARLGRILSLVPWIAAQDEVEIDEVCRTFAITRQELEADLSAIVVVGLYPRTSGDYIDLLWDEDELADSNWVSIGFNNFFERPLRLTLHETVALLAAGVAARDHPGHDPHGPLERGLVKLADGLGIDLEGDLAVHVSATESHVHADLTAAVENSRVVRVTYYSHARDETSERDLEPRRLFTSDGAAYLDAFCRLSDDDRIFRLDRIESLSFTGETFTPRDEGDIETEAFTPDAEMPRVTLEIPAEASWVVDAYPTERVEAVGERIQVTLAVAARPWLERLLLRLGPGTVVVDGPDELRSAGSEAARRLLDSMGR